MDVKVGKVEVDANGIRNLFKSAEVESALKEKCDERAKALESAAAAHLHSQHNGSLFVSKTKTLSNTCIGLVVSKGGTGRAGRASDASKTDIAQEINKKHNYIHW